MPAFRPSIMASFQPIRILLDEARSSHRFASSGHYWQITDASSAAVVIELQVNQSSNRKHTMRKGEGWVNDPYSEFYITHTAQAGEWVEISTGGDPQLAVPSLFRRFTEDALASVTVSNAAPIDVNVQNVPAIQGIPEYPAPLTEAEVFAVFLSTTSTAAVTLPSVATGGAPALDTVPVGKELLITQASGGTNDTRGGLFVMLASISPNVDSLQIPLVFHQPL